MTNDPTRNDGPGELSGTSTTSDDPSVEPDNSTVDDWIGQRIDRDQDLVDELLEETGGDAGEAERRFAERSHGDRPDSLPTEQRRT